MRLDAKLVHPSIFRASDEIIYAVAISGEASDDARESQQEWFRENGESLAVIIISFILVMIPAMTFSAGMPRPARAAIVLAIMAAVAYAMVVAFYRGRRRMTLRKLEALIPVAKFTETQRAYAQTLVALGKAGQPQSEIEETMRTLNALLDEEIRLLSMQAHLTGAEGSDNHRRLLEERAALKQRVDEAKDPSAHAAFEQSLSLLDERLASYDSHGTNLERVNAHLELLRQAILATRDAAHRLAGGGSLTAPDLGTDALRSAVALARAQTQATEQALAELRAI